MEDLNSEQKRAIKSTILECRGILEKDIEQVLINLGIYIDEDWIDINNLTNLNEEQRKTRENIEQVIEKLGKGGFDKNKAVIEYIKEVSYTYLNRIAALRVLEARGLIDEILISRPENGDKSFINSRFYEVAREYCKYNMDAGLSYLINLMFEEIGEEIKLLFSTEDEYSFISPSSNGLLAIIKLLCTNIDEESWQQDEIIGWIYQYFNDKEKDDVFDRLYNKKQKIKVEDIPAATQLFTPNWIVEWIVDNSLGTLWTEIKEGKRQGKKVEEIKLLDPCCGSGHFLVKAYDLFYKMYLEEGKYSVEEIPFKILENNIHGIDIDLRAVQLTGLILFIKTKNSLKKNNFDINTKGKVVLNLVCADAILLNGNRLIELKQKYSDNPVILKMVDVIYEEFKDVRLKGSLIKPEKKLYPLFKETLHKTEKKAKQKANAIKRKQTKGQITLESNDIFEELEVSSFTKEEKNLINTLLMVYNEAIRSNDLNKQLFASEAVKSVKLVEIFMNEYEVVITNPPYMNRNGYDDTLNDFLKNNYRGMDMNLYCPFIERIIDFTAQDGFCGAITLDSFMFLSTYSLIREKILESTQIEKMCHLGTKAFDDISGEKVSTAIFVLKKDQQHKKTDAIFHKLDNISNSNDKRIALENNDRKYVCDTKIFNEISGNPFVYWINPKVANLLLYQEKVSKYLSVKTGMNTGDNARFLRFSWEVNKNNKAYTNYVKGGGSVQYLGINCNKLYWNEELIKQTHGSAIRNKQFYFKEGLTFSGVNSKRFSVRYLPKGYVFDSGGSFINILNNDNIFYFLGLLNSKFMNYVLKILNPTINFKNDDIHRLPYIAPKKEQKEEIELLVKKIIDLKEELYSTNELYDNFQKPSLLKHKRTFIKDTLAYNSDLMDNILIDIEKYRQRIDEIVFEMYCLDNEIVDEVKSICGNYTLLNSKALSEKLVDKYLNEGKTIVEISEDLLYSIEEIRKYKNENFYNKFINSNKDINNLLSYFIGCIFGRWNCSKDIEESEIIPIGSSVFLEEDVLEKIYNCIISFYGAEDAEKILEEIEECLGKTIDEYFTNDFFQDHINKYYQKPQRRPIYWHICSAKKTFNCFVYYHKLDEDTLYKVKSIYLAKMIERYEEDLKYYNEQLIKARIDNDKNKEKDFKSKCSDLEEKLEDLNILDKNIMDILPYKPDLDKGVLYNIIPLESILAARVSTDKEREEYYKEVKKK